MDSKKLNEVERNHPRTEESHQQSFPGTVVNIQEKMFERI